MNAYAVRSRAATDTPMLRASDVQGMRNVKTMAKHNIKELDAGQLELMWNFLKFGEAKLELRDIKDLEKNLNNIRQLMVQKTGGQPQYANASDLLIDDLGTYINFVVIAAMRIFLAGGLDVLREHCIVRRIF